MYVGDILLRLVDFVRCPTHDKFGSVSVGCSCVDGAGVTGWNMSLYVRRVVTASTSRTRPVMDTEKQENAALLRGGEATLARKKISMRKTKCKSTNCTLLRAYY